MMNNFFFYINTIIADHLNSIVIASSYFLLVQIRKFYLKINLSDSDVDESRIFSRAWEESA